jgi:2-succinyl-5-enolpyruvyl-6-hydroxy-3-cyclohexene-1-carboxylate synthase
MAQQLQEPVIICSTSGSATLNYAPAICEAYYQKIPLLVLTADRPPEWIDQGEGQSINQNAIYNNYIAGSFQFPVDENPDTLWQSGRITNEAINLCVKNKQPVHINLPFREPLYETVKHSISRNKIELTLLDKSIKKEDWTLLTNQWDSFSKKLIICGLNQKNEKLNSILNKLSRDEQTIVLTETTSNLLGDDFIQCIDRTLERISGNPDFNPELIISLGGSIISKKIKLLFRKFNPKQHWHVNNDEKVMDVFTSLTRIIPMEEDLFFEDFISKINLSAQGKFKSMWLKEFFISEKKHLEFMKTAPWSDLKAHQLINQSIPKGANLHLGNSTSVRYVQLFNNTKKITFNGNRGVSGIDGSTSTALGAALASKLKTILITGDLSFVYDSNALWNNYIPENLKIIVLNNNGGGIFKIIPGAATSEFSKENFVSNNPANIKSLAQAHNVNYLYASSIEETKAKLNELFKNNSLTILEINTKKANNSDVLTSYFKEIKS